MFTLAIYSAVLFTYFSQTVDAGGKPSQLHIWRLIPYICLAASYSFRVSL